uniref:hypothetical protein n=1 Tax=Reticulibacter mediterranei TaxID=2778369 RepID=UPI001C6925BE|nr:hypothetical protein [Reticulibacter mediterranei]
MRRHWQLVCCAFSFCWYHASRPLTLMKQTALELFALEEISPREVPADGARTGEKNQRGKSSATTGVLAGSTANRTWLAGALDHAAALLERMVATAPTSCSATSAPMP